MTTILAAMQNSLLVLDSTKDGWKIHEHLKHHSPNSVALDPDNPSTAYCGTSEVVPYFSCIMNSILKYIPDIRPKGNPSVHTFGNPDDLYNLLENASFHNISIKKYTFLYQAGTFDEYWSDYISSTANSIRSIIESKGTNILSTIKEDSKVSADRFTDNNGILTFPWDVLIAAAHN